MLDHAFVVFLGLLAAFVLGVLVYVVVSYVHLLGYAPRRSLGAAVRSAALEGFWALVTQPLLPLYYLIGRRMGGTGNATATPVVVIHGYMQNRVDFIRIARALTQHGSGRVYGFNFAWWRPVADCAERLAAFVEIVCHETGAHQVDIVAHSMGGVVAIEYMQGGGVHRLRRCVTIASPYEGVAWRGPVVGPAGRQLRAGSAYYQQLDIKALPIPVLSIASTHDNVAHPPQTSTLEPKGGFDYAVEHAGHLTLLYHPAVVAAVVEHLSAEPVQAASPKIVMAALVE